MVDHLTLQAKIEDHAKRLGIFTEVIPFDPGSAPTGKGLTMAFWFGSMFPIPRESGLSATSMVQMMYARLFLNITTERTRETDPTILGAAVLVMRELTSDISFGLDDEGVWTDLLGNARNPGVRADPRYVKYGQGGALFRVVDITIPVVLEDFFAQSIKED
jgi:hypothetical protein